MKVPRWPPARPVRVAAILWLTFAFTVWNVVFDRILVVEGREYVYAAAVAVSRSAPYVLAEPWMTAAQTRALWIASGAAFAVAAIGLIGIGVARRNLKSEV